MNDSSGFSLNVPLVSREVRGDERVQVFSSEEYTRPLTFTQLHPPDFSGGGKRIDRVEDVLALGDQVKVVVQEIDDRDKVSLGMAEVAGDGESTSTVEPKESDDDHRGRDREPEKVDASSQASDKPRRTVVSFEDEFESSQ